MKVQNIRIKDIDFGFDKFYIWDSKSKKIELYHLIFKHKKARFLSCLFFKPLNFITQFHHFTYDNNRRGGHIF